MQHFYGGDPAAWFSLPTRKLRVYLAALPRLEAQDALAGVAITAAGSGQMKKSDHRTYIGALQKQAGTKKKAIKATAADLARLGIPVKEV